MNPTTEIAVRPNGAEVVRQEFGAVQTTQQHETAAVAVAAREAKAIEARYIMAMQRPRNVDQFRVNLLHACKRPTFAAKAEYAKPIGKEKDDHGNWVEKKAKGPSIRFIETALQMYGNVYPEIATVYDSPAARICRVTVTDLETNITYSSEVVVTKQVERKGKQDKRTKEWTPPEGRIVISERINSYGEPTYLVLATDDEVLVKQNALLSKALRTTAQRLLPYDIVEEAMRQAKATLADENAKDPDAAKKRLMDAFADLGVQPVDLEAYLGHSLNKPLAPAEREELLAIHTAIKEGETTWAQVMESKGDSGSEELAEEVRARKIAEAEAKLAAQKGQQQEQPQDEEPKREMNTSGFAPEPEAPKQTEQKASDAPEGRKPVFGRRNQ